MRRADGSDDSRAKRRSATVQANDRMSDDLIEFAAAAYARSTTPEAETMPAVYLYENPDFPTTERLPVSALQLGTATPAHAIGATRAPLPLSALAQSPGPTA